MSFRPKIVKFDPREFVSQADISVRFSDGPGKIIKSSVPEELLQTLSRVNLPLGNGRMAAPVTAEGSKIRIRLGHTDLFPFSAASDAMSADPKANYACGLADIEIDFGSSLFCGQAEQYINYYEGLCGFRGSGFDIRLTADMRNDLFAVRIGDDRPESPPVTVKITAIRPRLAENGSHRAVSEILQKDGSMLLRQTFTEECDWGDEKKNCYAQSSAAVSVFCDGDPNAEETSPPAENKNSLSAFSRRKTGENGKHRYLTVYIAGCVSCDPEADTGRIAAGLVRSGRAAGFDAVAEETAGWFADYWSRSFIRLDGRKKWLAAGTVLWIRFLYLFALSRRGEYPPLHQANPLYDATVSRTWGSRFWWFNQSRSEYGMLAVNHPELNAPLMRMTERNIPAYRDFARQAFLSDGICITETSAHDGYQRVPSAIAREMGPLFVYGRLPSAEYLAYGRARDHYLSMWNSLSCADPKGSYTMRLVYTAADIADLYRLHYLYSRDEGFLREKAYPMMKGAAEFYRSTPILHKEEDGLYHTFPTNYAETFWGARDVIDDIAMISSLFPTVVYYARKLDIDHDLIPLWQEIADHMAPIPASDMPDALSPRSKDGKRAFAMCRRPCLVPDSRGAGYPGTACDEQIRPVMNYDYVTLETKDAVLRELCMNTLEGHLVPKQAEEEKAGGKEVEMDDCSRFTVNCARLGRADLAMKHMAYQFGRIADRGPYDPETDDYPEALENLRGRAVMDLQQWSWCEGVAECLLGCCSDGGASDESVIYIAPAWDMNTDASFLLAARDGFEVACEITGGRIAAAEIFSRAGRPCVIRNTFGRTVTVTDGAGSTAFFGGAYIRFDTVINGHYIIR